MNKDEALKLVEEFIATEGVVFGAFGQIDSAPVGNSERWIVELKDAKCPWENGRTLSSITLMVNPDRKSVAIVQDS